MHIIECDYIFTTGLFLMKLNFSLLFIVIFFHSRVVLALPEFGWNLLWSNWIFTGAIDCADVPLRVLLKGIQYYLHFLYE